MRFVLQGAEVVDGTGSPRRRADVSVVGGHIEEVADTIDPRGDLSLDLEGLVLAPGFIDPHTHFDAQVLWDRDLTPSSWHGVTTVVTGNCGFGIAPTRPEHRSTIMRTLENVEGMPLTALEAGLPWTFETFPQYLDAVEAAPNRLNVACLAGHTPLRFYVLGEEATERNASADELATMRQLLRDALDAGAVGFSTSRSESHRGAYGRPVPSRAATLDEIRVLASVLGECGHGTLEATWGPDLFVDEFAALAREIGRPVTWAALMTLKADPEYSVRITREIEQAGGTVFPQISCSPIVVQLSLAEPAPLANVPAFGEILSLPGAARAALYADPLWRERARAEVRERWGDKLDDATVQETERHRDLRHGPTLGQLARQRGTDSLDVMVDLALAEELTTRFRIVMTNDDDDQIGELLRNPRFLLGLSDAGAHTSQLCDAGNTTTLLSHWVRERRALTLEARDLAHDRSPGRGLRADRSGPDRPGLGERPGGVRSRHGRLSGDRARLGLSGRGRPPGDAEHRDTPCLGERHPDLVRRGVGPSGRDPVCSSVRA